MKPTVRFFFDWGTDACFWGDEGLQNAKDWGLSDSLSATLKAMGEEFQSALNWEYPLDPSPWSEAQKADFMRRSEAVYEQICAEIGHRYEVVFRVFVPK